MENLGVNSPRQCLPSRCAPSTWTFYPCSSTATVIMTVRRFLEMFLMVVLPMCVAGAGIAQEAPTPRLLVTGEPQVVFRWATQRCNVEHIPDSPARALRTSSGEVVLLAAHYTNVLLRGRDLDSLAPACTTESRGAEDPDPEAFNDRYWVQAVVPLPDGRVLGLASHEYLGARHAGRCSASEGRPALRCWYSAITATVAEQADWRFRPLPLPARMVAAPRDPYNPAAARRSGFFSVTNIVLDGGFGYVMVYTEGVTGQREGNCLLRAPRTDLVEGWRALAGGEFGLHLGAIQGEGGLGRTEPCDLIGTNVFSEPIRSVVRMGPDGPWVALFISRAPGGTADGESHGGVSYSLSTDLRQWSAPVLLWAAKIFAGQPEAGIYFQYPSLIDHESPSVVFDVLANRPYLYLTRFNLSEDRRRGMDRDLVRLPLVVNLLPN